MQHHNALISTLLSLLTLTSAAQLAGRQLPDLPDLPNMIQSFTQDNALATSLSSIPSLSISSPSIPSITPLSLSNPASTLSISSLSVNIPQTTYPGLSTCNNLQINDQQTLCNGVPYTGTATGGAAQMTGMSGSSGSGSSGDSDSDSDSGSDSGDGSNAATKQGGMAAAGVAVAGVVGALAVVL